MSKKIFITGATGCIGHYVVDRFLNNSQFELHLLARNPERFRFDYQKATNVVVHQGDLYEIEKLKKVVSDMDYLIHIATSWRNSEKALELNRDKTHVLFNMLDPKKCKKIVYFSTASILGPGNKTLPEAGKYGSGYVSSKYEAYLSLSDSPMYSKIVTLFPTLVFGGDKHHPYSHISSGIIPNLKLLKVIRFFKPTFSFHFLHGADIAQIVEFVLLRETDRKEYVIGNPMVTAEKAIQELCKVFNLSVFFQISIKPWMVLMLAKSFNIKIGKWERFLIDNPHFKYDVVSPKSFGLPGLYPSLFSVFSDVLKQAKLSSK